MIGEGRPLDTRRFFVVCINSLGSPFGSSSPASVDPATGRPYGIAFPEIAVEDIAAAGHEALRSLGIERVAAVVGPSLGGMVVLAYCAQFPGEVENLVTISGAAHATPFAIALRSLQREMVRSDPAWRGGNYQPGRGPRLGLRLARKLGTITYRSPQEWDERFGRRRVPETAGLSGDFRPQFEVEAYLEHQALRFADAVRRERLPVPVARHGPVRPRRSRRRVARGRVRAIRRAALAGDRRRDRHAVPDRPAARDRGSPARGGWIRWNSTPSRRCRATTRS